MVHVHGLALQASACLLELNGCGRASAGGSLVLRLLKAEAAAGWRILELRQGLLAGVCWRCGRRRCQPVLSRMMRTAAQHIRVAVS